MTRPPTISAETLQALADKGLTQSEAAQRLDRSLSTVHDRAIACGVKFRDSNMGRNKAGPTEDELREMAEAGLAARDIAERSGCSRRTVERRAADLGIELRKAVRRPRQSKRAPVKASPPKPDMSTPQSLLSSMWKIAAQENKAMRERCFNK